MTTAPAPTFGPDFLKRSSTWFLFLGILLIILGIVALSAAFVATMASVILIGWLLIFAGVAHLVHAFGTGQWGPLLWHLLAGIIDLIAGAWLIFQPVIGGITLTLILAIMLIIGGVFQVIGALSVRWPNWGWALLSGLASIVLGAMVWSGWPASGLWFIGLWVGLSLLFRGWALVMLSATARAVAKSVAGPAA